MDPYGMIFIDPIASGKRLQFATENGPVEIVDLPIQHGEFPYGYVSLPECIPVQWKAPELDVVRCWLWCCEMLWSCKLAQFRKTWQPLATSTTQHVDFPCFQMDVHSIGFRRLQISPGLPPIQGARGPISTMEGHAAVSAATSRTACLGNPRATMAHSIPNLELWTLGILWVYKVYPLVN